MVNWVDAQGYAVVSSIRAFQPNVISIDPNGTAYDVELKESTQTTVPTLGCRLIADLRDRERPGCGAQGVTEKR